MIGVMQSTATAQEKAAENVSVIFTTQIGDSICYSTFELAEIIFVGQTPSDAVASSILEEYQSFTGEEDDPVILQYGEIFICIQYDADNEIVFICLKNTEFGWCESDPHQENILWKLGLLVEFSFNVFE